MALPRITLVVPNYNYGRFLDACLRSIEAQGYPNLELMVMDGGSTDGSVDIIKDHAAHLAYWVSEKDGGQTRAINRALERCTGDWFNWLNSDDLLAPGALATLADILELYPEAKWVSGARLGVDAEGRTVDVCAPWRTDPASLLLEDVFFPQDATFVRTQFLRQAGGIPDLRNVFDTVLHLRLSQVDRPVLTTAVFSMMRWHGENKTLDRSVIAAEMPAVLRELQALQPPWRQAAARLCRTRVRSLVRGVLGGLAVHEHFPWRRGWRVAAMDPATGKMARSTLGQVFSG